MRVTHTSPPQIPLGPSQGGIVQRASLGSVKTNQGLCIGESFSALPRHAFLKNGDWLRHRRGTVPDQDSPHRCLSQFSNPVYTPLVPGGLRRFRRSLAHSRIPTLHSLHLLRRQKAVFPGFWFCNSGIPERQIPGQSTQNDANIPCRYTHTLAWIELLVYSVDFPHYYKEANPVLAIEQPAPSGKAQ